MIRNLRNTNVRCQKNRENVEQKTFIYVDEHEQFDIDVEESKQLRRNRANSSTNIDVERNDVEQKTFIYVDEHEQSDIDVE